MDFDLLAYDIYVGFDVGKHSHHAVALRAADQQVILNRNIEQDEKDIRDTLNELEGFGRLLVAVDQKGSVGRLLVATVKDAGIDIGFLTPSDFHAFSKGYTEIKSDAKDAYIIADIAMRFTDRLSAIIDFDEAVEALKVKCTLREALVRDNVQGKNRIHSLLVQTHPAFEACIGRSNLNNSLYLAILAHYGGPCGIRSAGQKRLRNYIAKFPYYGGKADTISRRIFDAISCQTVLLPGSIAREDAIKVTASAIMLRKQEIEVIEKEIKALYQGFEEAVILSSMPGIGKILGAVILSETGDISQYRDAGHLAAYAGVAPSKRQSGTTLNYARRKIKCNRRLKNAFCESARISIRCDEWSAWYYQKKRAEGKKHLQAIVALARHRTDIIYAMLKTGSLYEPKTMTR